MKSSKTAFNAAKRWDAAAVTALLKAGADLEAHVPMPAEEGDFRANPVWYAASRGEICRW